jgi:hypothetical protein
MGFLDPLKGFGVTFGMMFKKVATEKYPEVKKVTAPRYHGKHQLNRHPDGLGVPRGRDLRRRWQQHRGRALFPG